MSRDRRQIKSGVGIFSKKSTFNLPVEELFAWHERDGAIERLSPPWDPLRVIHKSGGIERGARVILGMKEGPVRYRWHAVHTDFEKNRLFRDQQTRGPLASWIHTHRFEPVGENRSTLEDTIEYKPYLSTFSKAIADPFIRRKLKRIFSYRHKTTGTDLELHGQFRNQPRKHILISGASGLLGQKLISFLKTGGHTVFTLVRRQPEAENEIYWNPAKGDLDSGKVSGMDAVIHLSGENVSNGRWTAGKMKKILDSRIISTRLLANTISKLDPKPAVFISSSATGYYGDGGDEILTEASPSGKNFMASVCSRWEEAAREAEDNGIRTVLMRIGVVITPEGGALKKLHLPYRLGLGGRIGSGDQYISWVGIDDTLAAFYWAMMAEEICGPVNLVSPNPLTFFDFSKTIASILSRPAVLPLAESVIKLMFGQMGEEGLLSSTRAKPGQLLDSGFQFRHPNLEEALRHVLGK